MKAEPEPQPDATALGPKVMQLPNLGRIWLGRGLMALAVVAVVIFFILTRMSRSKQQASDARELLALARVSVQRIDTLNGSSNGMSLAPLDVKFVEGIQRNYDDAKVKLQEFAERSKDPLLDGQAALLRGDLNLALAAIPVVPGATTQPDKLISRPPREDAYRLASEAYNEVLQKYANQPNNVAAARIGLATIALDHNDFAAAENEYKAVANDDAAAGLFRDVAKKKLALLPSLKQPALVEVNAIPPLTPAASQPATGPATRPATAPAK